MDITASSLEKSLSLRGLGPPLSLSLRGPRSIAHRPRCYTVSDAVLRASSTAARIASLSLRNHVATASCTAVCNCHAIVTRAWTRKLANPRVYTGAEPAANNMPQYCKRCDKHGGD
eukprot:gene5685-biopygen1726